jgi:hypothetical protein
MLVGIGTLAGLDLDELADQLEAFRGGEPGDRLRWASILIPDRPRLAAETQ